MNEDKLVKRWYIMATKLRWQQNSGPTEIRTRIAGFKVQSANHYTIGPTQIVVILKYTSFSHSYHKSFSLFLHNCVDLGRFLGSNPYCPTKYQLYLMLIARYDPTNTLSSTSGWPSGLRRCVQVAVHFCGRGFESHFWQQVLISKMFRTINSYKYYKQC